MIENIKRTQLTIRMYQTLVKSWSTYKTELNKISHQWTIFVFFFKNQTFKKILKRSIQTQTPIRPNPPSTFCRLHKDTRNRFLLNAIFVFLFHFCRGFFFIILMCWIQSDRFEIKIKKEKKNYMCFISTWIQLLRNFSRV